MRGLSRNFLLKGILAMKTYTDEEIFALIKCPKIIADPPSKQMKEERGHRRSGMTLRSKDNQFEFRVFMRQSLAFEEDFSVGLDYIPRDEAGSLCLFRCNGKHGGHQAHPHHLSYHIHTVKAEDVNAGIRLERHIEITAEYASFFDAIGHFIALIAVEGAEKYYPFITRQKDLFGES